MPEPGEQGEPGRESTALPTTGNPATDAALALLTQLVREGLRHLVLSPGSRSQALALVAAELHEHAVVEHLDGQLLATVPGHGPTVPARIFRPARTQLCARRDGKRWGRGPQARKERMTAWVRGTERWSAGVPGAIWLGV